MKFRILASPETDDLKSKYDRIYNSDVPNLKVVVKNNLWGAINEDGEEVVPLNYDELSNFSKGFGIALTSSGYGLIDSKNTVLLPFEYKLITEFEQEKNLCFIALKTNSVKIFSPSLKFDVTFENNDLFPYDSAGILDLAEINFKKINEYKIIEIVTISNQFCYLIYTGSDFKILKLNEDKILEFIESATQKNPRLKIPSEKYVGRPFKITHENFTKKLCLINIFSSSDTKFALCYIENYQLIPAIISDMEPSFVQISDRVFIQNKFYHDPYSTYRTYKGLYTFDGEEFLPAIYVQIENLNNIHRFKVTENGESHFIDLQTGKKIEVDETDDLKEIKVQRLSDENVKIFYENKEIAPEKTFKFFQYFIKNNNKYFLAGNENELIVGDKYGRIVKELPYQSICNIGAIRDGEIVKILSERESNVSSVLNVGVYRKNDGIRVLKGISAVKNSQSECGVIDENFKEIVPPVYSMLEYYNDEKHRDYLIVKKFNKYGLITINNQLILPFIYNYIQSINYERGAIYKVKVESSYERGIALNPENLKKYSKRMRNIVYSSPGDVVDQFGIGINSQNASEVKNDWVKFHQDIYKQQFDTEPKNIRIRRKRKNKQPDQVAPVIETNQTETPQIEEVLAQTPTQENTPNTPVETAAENELITKNFYVTQRSSGNRATIRGRGRNYDECRQNLIDRLIERYPNSTEADYTIEDAPDDVEAQ